MNSVERVKAICKELKMIQYFFSKYFYSPLDSPRIAWYYIITERDKEEITMKKYNLSKIMKRAWELVKKAGETISSGLKKAWQEAKKMTYEAIEKAA